MRYQWRYHAGRTGRRCQCPEPPAAARTHAPARPVCLQWPCFVVAIVVLLVVVATAGAGGRSGLRPAAGRWTHGDPRCRQPRTWSGRWPCRAGTARLRRRLMAAGTRRATRTGVATRSTAWPAPKVRTSPESVVPQPSCSYRDRSSASCDQDASSPTKRRVDVLDLDRGRRYAASPCPPDRTRGNQPAALGSERRTRLADAARRRNPAHARVVAHADAALAPSALAPNPGGIAVDVASEDGRMIRIDDVSLDRTTIGRIHGTINQLLIGNQGVVGRRAADGRVLAVRARDGRVLDVMHVPRRSRLAIVGGWLAVGHGHAVRLLILGGSRAARRSSCLARRGVSRSLCCSRFAGSERPWTDVDDLRVTGRDPEPVVKESDGQRHPLGGRPLAPLRSY